MALSSRIAKRGLGAFPRHPIIVWAGPEYGRAGDFPARRVECESAALRWRATVHFTFFSPVTSRSLSLVAVQG